MTDAINKLKVIGNNIKMHRKAMKWTQEQLAKNVGVTSSIISKFELGTKPVDVITLIKIAYALGIKYSELFRVGATKTMFHNIPVSVREWEKLMDVAGNKGIESDDLAEMIGVTPMAFYNYNTGRNNASLETFQKILNVCEISPEDFDTQEALFDEEPAEVYDDFPAEDKTDKIIKVIDCLIDALEDIRTELCG